MRVSRNTIVKTKTVAILGSSLHKVHLKAPAAIGVGAHHTLEADSGQSFIIETLPTSIMLLKLDHGLLLVSKDLPGAQYVSHRSSRHPWISRLICALATHPIGGGGEGEVHGEEVFLSVLKIKPRPLPAWWPPCLRLLLTLIV